MYALSKVSRKSVTPCHPPLILVITFPEFISKLMEIDTFTASFKYTTLLTHQFILLC